jgi:hypothetical protein
MSRGGVGDATGTVPEAVHGAPTPCEGRKRPPVPAEANDRGGTRYGGLQARREPVSPGRGSVRRRSAPAVVEQPGDRLGAPSSDHDQARSLLRCRTAVLRRREGVGPERLSRPVGGQPRIRGFASSAEEVRSGGGTFRGHAAEALRERIGSSTDPQDLHGRNQAPPQRGCHRADGFQVGSNRWVPASRDRRTQADHCGSRAHRRRYSLRGELRGPACWALWVLVIGRRRWHTPGRALPKG